MYNKKTHVKVESNVFDIPNRIKDIDPSYFILMNRHTGKFEVHSTDNEGSTYCFTVPYEGLDSRTLEHTHKTKVENAKALFEEMERLNDKLELDRNAKFEDDTKEYAKEIYRYSCQDTKSVECRLNKKVVRE